jgi:hypothetical protein
LIQKEISATLNHKWNQTLVDNYNNLYHDTIKMSSVEARINTKGALANIEKRAQKHTGRKYDNIKVGDKVRIKIFKKKVEKYLIINWSMDLYIVEKVRHPTKLYNSTIYKIQDDHLYTRNDLQLVNAVKKPLKTNREIDDN